MGKRQKQVLGFTTQAKEEVLRNLGFSCIEYSGKISEAPQQIRHLVRELEPGVYLVNLHQHSIVKRMDINASGHKFVYGDTASLLSEQFKEAIFYVLQRDYVYALKNSDGTFDFTGYLADNAVIKVNVIATLAQSSFKAGYYGVQIDGVEVRFTTEPYTIFENLLVDLAIYAPSSPFKQYAKPIMSSVFDSLDLVYNKFQFSGDAVITLTPARNGKLVATVVNYPEIDGIERLFVQAPNMLRLLLALVNTPNSLENLKELQSQAQNIIGVIGT